MSWLSRLLSSAALLIVLFGSVTGKLTAQELYTDIPLDELPFAISAEGLTEEQIRATLEEIGEIPDGAFVSIAVVDSEVLSGDEWPFEFGSSALPPGFELRPLDDPGNPYQEQYGEWDVWEYENYLWLCEEYGFDQFSADERCDFMNAEHDDPRLQNNGDHLLMVRGDGYLVPTAVMVTAQAEETGLGFGWGSTLEFAGEHICYDVNTSFTIWSFGNMSEELQNRKRTAENLSRVSFTPSIPKWLADNPPMWVTFIPGNEIITLGPLGSWDDEEALSTGAWYRFSCDGELLGQTTPDQQWWFEIFFPEFRQKWIELGDIPEIQFQDINGIITFCRYDPYEELAVYDYMGNPDPDPFKWYNELMLFSIIEGRDIPAMYAAQQQGD
jgi:hypothetical protein